MEDKRPRLRRECASHAAHMYSPQSQQTKGLSEHGIGVQLKVDLLEADRGYGSRDSILGSDQISSAARPGVPSLYVPRC